MSQYTKDNFWVYETWCQIIYYFQWNFLSSIFYAILRSNKNCIFFHSAPCQEFPLTTDRLCSHIKPKNEVLEKRTDKSWTIQIYWTFKNNLSIFFKNKLFAIKPKLHSFRPKKELPHTRKYKWVFKTKLSEHMYRKRKSQHILASFHLHNRTVTKDMIWQPGRRINIGFWHLTNTPLYNTSEWITFISKTFTFHICGEKVPAVFDQNAKRTNERIP